MNYRMPAEWEPQAATWLAWPHNKEDWPDRFEPIPWVYVEIIRYLTQVQRVRLIVKNEKHDQQARDLFERAGIKLRQVDFITAGTDRVWLRDSGPTFVYATGGKQADPALSAPHGARSSAHRGQSNKVLLDWHFNAWAKYPNWRNDDKVPQHVEQFLSLPRIQPMVNIKGKETRMVLEGGSIDVNGKGVLLTSEECLLSTRKQCRNPGLSREGYEEAFAKYLGISQVIWLGDGIVGDDTHGHIDDLARFVKADTIVTMVEKDKTERNHEPLKDNLKRLKAARYKDKPFTVVELPMPHPVYFEGQRLPSSYANFLIANGLVLVPTFNDPNDRVALNILSELMPRHEVVGIYCGDFIWGLGTIHCASQQEIV